MSTGEYTFKDLLTESVWYRLYCFYTCIWVENGLRIEMKNELNVADVDNEDIKGSNLIKR